MVDLNNKIVLVTGGCGFIGSNFIKLVFNNYKNFQIVNVDKMGIGSRSLKSLYIPEQYTEVELDVRDLKFITQLPVKQYDYIIHFAAESHVDRSINSPYEFISNNVLGAARLLDWYKSYYPNARFLHVSTDEVYGHLGIDDKPFTETSNILPRSPYAASKASSDLVALSYYETYGIDVLVTRCCNNYGPQQYSEKFIPTIIRSLQEVKKIPVYGNGTNIREWIHVDDHNRSLLEILKMGTAGTVYNIGSGIEKTNLQLIQDIASIMDESGNIIQFVEDRKGHDFRYAISSDRYIREFKLLDFQIALRSTIMSYIK